MPTRKAPGADTRLDTLERGLATALQGIEVLLAQRAAIPAPVAADAAKLESAIAADASASERKTRKANTRGGPSQVAKAPEGPATPEEIAQRRYAAQIRRYAAISTSPTATDADRRDAAKLTARLTHWLATDGSYVAAMANWGKPAPSELAAREARAMKRSAKADRKATAPVQAARKGAAAESVTLAQFLAMGGTLITPDGKRVSA